MRLPSPPPCLQTHVDWFAARHLPLTPVLFTAVLLYMDEMGADEFMSHLRTDEAVVRHAADFTRISPQERASYLRSAAMLATIQ